MEKIDGLQPPVWVLQADGVGEYAVRHPSGARCVFLFTNRESLLAFMESMELPELKKYTATELTTHSLVVAVLREFKKSGPFVALDPVAYCEFNPINIDLLMPATDDFHGG